MKFKNSHLGLQITINESLLKCFERKGRKFYPNEYGGILIGYYTEEGTNVIIVESIMSTTKGLSPTRFKRSFDKEKLIKFYNQVPRLIYIGEWHTHPDAPCIPSITDWKAMDETARHPQVQIENPILLIISVYKKTFDYCFYAYFKEKIYPYKKLSD